MEKRTISQDFVNLSVRHNGLFLPGHSLQRALSRYCVCLAVWTGSDEYPVYLPGSATLLRYKDRYFLICTRHQLTEEDFESVCIMLPNGKQSRCITSGGAIWWSAEINDGDHNQIVIFDFTGPCIELSDLRALFLDFRHQHPDVPADNVVALLAYGYPTKGRNYDADARHIELGQCFVLCRFIGGGSDDAVHVIAPLKPLSFDPDGMSGGAAFCLLHDTEGFSIHLAGVIVRGGQHRLRLIKAGAVQMVLEEFIRSRPL